MQKLFIRVILSLTLTANILSCIFNMYDNLSETNKTTKIVEAPLYITPAAQAFWRAVKYLFLSGGGTGKSPIPKPSGSAG